MHAWHRTLRTLANVPKNIAYPVSNADLLAIFPENTATYSTHAIICRH